MKLLLGLLFTGLLFAQAPMPQGGQSINYTPLGTGAVTRTINGKLQETVSLTDYGAKGDAKILTDGAITTATATFTSASAAFTSADAGKPIYIIGAGAAAVPLATTILSFTNSTTVTLAANAGTTVTGAQFIYGTNDTAAITTAIAAASGKTLIFLPGSTYFVTRNTLLDFGGVKRVIAYGVTINGLLANLTQPIQWNGGNFTDVGRVDGGTMFWVTGSSVYMRDVTATYANCYAALQLSHQNVASDFSLDNWNFTYTAGNSSVITVTSANNARISNGSMNGPTSGTVDDGIAVFALDGNTEDIVISNITANNVYDVMKILPNSTNYLRNVSISNVTAENVQSVLYYQSATVAAVSNISASHIDAYDPVGNRTQSILLFTPQGGTTWYNISLSDIHFRGRTNNTGGQNNVIRIIGDSAATKVKGFKLDGITWDDLYDGVANDGGHPGFPAASFLYYQASVGGGNVTASDWEFVNLYSNGVANELLNTSADVGNFRVNDSYFKNSSVSNASGQLLLINTAADFTSNNTVYALTGSQTIGTTGNGTLTVANAKTATISNSLTLAGTDSTTMTFPATSATVARTDAGNQFTGISTFSGNRLFVASSDFSTAGNTNLQTITGLSFILPANTALNVPFQCHLAYSQATAAVADSFGISASVNPTNIFGTGHMQTSATVFTEGNLPTLSTTTATAIVTATPSAITTIWNADLHGFIENPSQAASTINVMVKTSTSADVVTVKRGSFCVIQ